MNGNISTEPWNNDFGVGNSKFIIRHSFSYS